MAVDLLILGAGGTSREIATAVRDRAGASALWNLLGFLDDDAALHGREVDGVPVLGPIDSAARYSAKVVVGVARAGDPWRRRRVVERIGLPRERFATIVHPSASVAANVRIGIGSAILQNVVVTTATTIGEHVIVHYNVSISHDCVIEDYVTMAPGVTCTGSVRLKSGAYLGAGATIMNGITVNSGAIVGLGAVVFRTVAADTTVIGNPAQPLNAKRAS